MSNNIDQALYGISFFNTQREAVDFYKKLLDDTMRFGTVSVHDLYFILDKCCDYTWDKYGWTSDDIFNGNSFIFFDKEARKWRVHLKRPYYLDGPKKESGRYDLVDVEKELQSFKKRIKESDLTDGETHHYNLERDQCLGNDDVPEYRINFYTDNVKAYQMANRALNDIVDYCEQKET